jgi:maltose alpha-D-glucosyltransferase/alpha-amylase
VSGFHMDAVPFVISTKGPQVTRPKEQYDMLRRFREFLQWRQGDLIVLAEANVLPDTDLNYFGEEGERMQMMFNFQVNQNLFYALAAADSGPLVKAMQATKPRPATAQWGQFLRNHDELDLGRLSEQQRRKSLPGSRRIPRCSSTIAAFAAGSRRCSRATAGASRWPTA